MPHSSARLCAAILLMVLGLCACSPSPSGQAAVATAQPAIVAAAPPATAPSQPTATAAPTSAPTTPPTAAPTSIPTATAAPSPTPDPWAEYEPFTIEALRSRSYGTEGQIEIVRVLEQTANFTRYLIAYPSDGLRITGMMNRPKGDGPFPVVILNHGYYPLDVYQTGNGSKTAADYLANRGFLALAPDFRSHAGSDNAPNMFRAGHVIDALNLIPLAQKLPETQPGKVGVWGHSNGGAITAKMIAISDQIAAAVIYSPASSNIVEDYHFRADRAGRRTPSSTARGTISRVMVEFPVTPDQAPELYERLSPLPYLSFVQADVQIHWGTADETVPYKWPGDLLAGLQAAGKQVEYFEYPGQPHSFQGASNQLYLRRVAEFFAEHLQAQG
ncbi:MAG TPA: alpha/beta fold hydrolase [Roseiflexaceae bacterium]|nr:alpha/beta fold hydrolase [Roseiflexaceae bacterium]